MFLGAGRGALCWPLSINLAVEQKRPVRKRKNRPGDGIWYCQEMRRWAIRYGCNTLYMRERPRSDYVEREYLLALDAAFGVGAVHWTETRLGRELF